MEIFFIATFIFIFAVSVFFGFLTAQLIKANAQQTYLREYIKYAINKINSARYDNFQTKLQNQNDVHGLYKSLNDLFESIYDRDLVITEYREKEKENIGLKEEFIAALTHDLKVPIIALNKTYDLLLQNKFGGLSQAQKGRYFKIKRIGCCFKRNG